MRYQATLCLLFVCICVYLKQLYARNDVDVYHNREVGLDFKSIQPQRRLQRRKPRATLDTFIKKAGISMINMLDIGANRGDFTRSMLKLFPNLSSTMIEGNKEHKESWLDIQRGAGYIGVIASKTGQQTWFRYENGPSTGDSMFRETGEFGSKMMPHTVDVLSLDDFITNNAIKNSFDFIKIDVQGAELEILRGGTKTLKGVKAILLELPFFGVYNEGSPDFVEYVSFMKEIDFHPYEITEMHSIRTFLMQVDILFLHGSVRREMQTDKSPKLF